MKYNPFNFVSDRAMTFRRPKTPEEMRVLAVEASRRALFDANNDPIVRPGGNTPQRLTRAIRSRKLAEAFSRIADEAERTGRAPAGFRVQRGFER